MYKWPQLKLDQLSKQLKDRQKRDKGTKVPAKLDQFSLALCVVCGQMGGSRRTGLMIFKC